MSPSETARAMSICPMGPDAGLGAYRRAFRDMVRLPVKAAITIIGSGTLTGLDACLMVECARFGLGVEVAMAPYNQIENAVYAPAAAARDGLQVVLLAWDTEWLLGDDLRNPYQRDASPFGERFTVRAQQVQAIIAALLARADTLVIVHDFVVPTASPLDLLEQRQEGGMINSIAALNTELNRSARGNPRLWISHIDALASALGKWRWTDANLRLLGDIRIRPDHLPWVASQAARIVIARAGLVRKCLVLDADDTLWGGVLGEDGPTGIKVGPGGDGQPFWEFQQVIAGLWERGVILAICSRNERADVIGILDSHPGMLLRSAHFATLEIGWGDKEHGLAAIAERLNIGLDSLVFLDNDPANRLRVRGALPQVLVPELPENPAEYAEFLARSGLFPWLHLTEEDRDKGRQYAAQAQRDEFRLHAGSITEYLTGLQTRASIHVLGPTTVARAAQLCQKTNQFNTTGHRYDEDALLGLAAEGWTILVVGVRDRFGDHGLTGLLISRQVGSALVLRLFLLSCRVLGRMLEHAILAKMADDARGTGMTAMEVEFVHTERNRPAEDFLDALGGVAASGATGAACRVIPVESVKSCPSHIMIERI